MDPLITPLLALGLAAALVGAGLLALRLRRAARRATMLERRLTWYFQARPFSGIGRWEWNAATNRWTWSDEVFRLRGFEPAKDISAGEMFYARVHPDDRFGDLVPQCLAKRLGRMPRTPGSAQHMATIVHGVAEQVFTPMTIEGVEVTVGASIGLSLYPEAATTPAGLIAAADQAMYRAKTSGGMVALHLCEPVSDTHQPGPA